MSFAAYLLYMALAFLRPTELFWPDLEDYRPMVWLWVFAFVSALVTVLARREIAARRLYFGLLGLFVVTIGASQAFNSSWSAAVDAVSSFSTSAMFFVLSCMNLTSTRRVRITCTVLLLCIGINAVMGITAYHYGWMSEQLVQRQNADNQVDVFEIVDPDVIPAEDTSGQYLWRVRSAGFLNDPNDFGQVLVLVLPFLWAFWEKRHLLRNLFFVAIPTAVILYAIYLTYSRGALVGLAALFIFVARRRLGTIKVAVLAGLLIFAASVANIGFGGREFSTKEESAGERIEAWYSGLQMLKAKPVFGVGYSNFLQVHPLTAHNSIVLCFAELGLVGYFFWGALLVLAYRELDQVLRRTPPGSPSNRLVSMLLPAFESFMVCAWFLSRTYQPTLYLLLAFCASAAWCARRENAEGEVVHTDWPEVSWLVPTLIADFAGIAAVYAFVLLSHAVG